MVIVVLAKKRLEPTDMSDISAMLKFLNHEKNPDKFLFLVNERRNKSSNRETKETNLSLSLLEVDNPKILQIGSDTVNNTSNSLAMTVSNIENDDFKEELKQIKDFLHAANEMTNLLQLPEKTSSQKFRWLFWTVGTATAGIFAFFLIKHFCWDKKGLLGMYYSTPSEVLPEALKVMPETAPVATGGREN